jgi:predicted nucleic acid-binding protein
MNYLFDTNVISELIAKQPNQMENAGHPIAAIDSLIAAIALAGNYCLVTRNAVDFQHTGVIMINPWT